MRILIISLILFFGSTVSCIAQEWDNLKTYQKTTGNETLKAGHWLKKDRKKGSEIWQAANLYNLQSDSGFHKYQSIAEIRDFYRWFDVIRIERGHEVKWIGLAAIAAKQLAKLDRTLIQGIIVRNKELQQFANKGSKTVFEYAFPLLKTLYLASEKIEAKAAHEWIVEYGRNEQCHILEPLYQSLSIKSLKQLEKMAKGKGIYNLAVPNAIKYKGEIENCEDRFQHGMQTLLPYYLNKRNTEFK
ncbi:hypothetical protein [Crocinitomix catalasitica]|uniref:hypothetical protein n=1 Tax=Crocinitomix catalasitica TaxID=184607 RepID=UPI00047FEF28|nr:hypothetical protein [Crocinitomix catalasitica]